MEVTWSLVLVTWSFMEVTWSFMQVTWSLVLVMGSNQMMHPPDEVPGFWVSAGHKQSLNDVYLLRCWLETAKKKIKNVLLRNSQHSAMSHPSCSNVMCINILQSNFKFAYNNRLLFIWNTYCYALAQECAVHLYDLVPKWVKVKSGTHSTACHGSNLL